MISTNHSGARHARRGAAGAAAGLLLMPALAAAQSGAPPTIDVGQIAPFTGSAAEFGEFYRDGAALGFKHLNAATQEVMGGPVIGDLIVEDTNTLPTPAIQSARKLVEQDGVPAIIGAWSSGVTVAVATSVTIPSEVLQISNGSTSPLISVLPEDEAADLLFRTTAPDTNQGIVGAQLARGEIIDGYKFDSVATIFVNNPYGQGLSNAFAKAFEQRGGRVQAQVPHPEQIQPTYTSQLSKAYEDDPELLYAASYPGHTATFLQEARDIMDKTTWQFVEANRSSEVIEALGSEDLAGKYGTAPGQDPSLPGFKNFSKAFKAAYDHERVPPFTESAYDAAMVLGLAMAKAVKEGHTDADEITGSVLRDRLRDVANPPGQEVLAGDQDSILAGVKAIMNGEDVDYAGAAGPADFDERGDVITPIAIWQYTEDGDSETLMIREPKQIPDK